MSPRLATSICGVPLRTPVLAAAGTYAYGVELERLVPLSSLGGIVTKGLSREPMQGNAAPRLFETHGGMLNSVGLQNIGVHAFVKEKLPQAARLGTPIFANVFGYTIEDYVEVLRVLEDAEGIAGYELNVSCPNTKQGGIFFSSDEGLLAEVVLAARAAITSSRPLIVKLSPNVTRIQPLALATEQAGANAISLVNTLVGLAIDAKTRRPRLGNGFGGLSGPAIKPVALRLVWEAYQTVRIPIIGLGGIMTGEDAAEFMIAGASAVEIGTANFWEPATPVRVARELDRFLKNHNVAKAADLTGTLKL